MQLTHRLFYQLLISSGLVCIRGLRDIKTTGFCVLQGHRFKPISDIGRTSLRRGRFTRLSNSIFWPTLSVASSSSLRPCTIQSVNLVPNQQTVTFASASVEFFEKMDADIHKILNTEIQFFHNIIEDAVEWENSSIDALKVNWIGNVEFEQHKFFWDLTASLCAHLTVPLLITLSLHNTIVAGRRYFQRSGTVIALAARASFSAAASAAIFGIKGTCSIIIGRGRKPRPSTCDHPHASRPAVFWLRSLTTAVTRRAVKSSLAVASTLARAALCTLALRQPRAQTALKSAQPACSIPSAHAEASGSEPPPPPRIAAKAGAVLGAAGTGPAWPLGDRRRPRLRRRRLPGDRRRHPSARAPTSAEAAAADPAAGGERASPPRGLAAALGRAWGALRSSDILFAL